MLSHVKEKDFMLTEGAIKDARGIALALAIKEAIPGISGDALNERIEKKYGLGRGGPDDAPRWVNSMNAAIDIWNGIPKKDAQSISAAFNV